MHVIGHQAVGVHEKPSSFPNVAEKTDARASEGNVGENGRPGRRADRDGKRPARLGVDRGREANRFARRAGHIMDCREVPTGKGRARGPPLRRERHGETG
jgi:hypothetical protein